MARGTILVVTGAAATAGVLATSADASSLAYAQAGVDLTRLLQAMALLKAILALGVVAAVLWRLGEGATLPRVALYALAAGAMVAGPGVVWGMVYVRTGAALLHGGLLVTVVLLWRDPVVSARLAGLLSKRASERSRGTKAST
jgi:hypothetical protein